MLWEIINGIAGLPALYSLLEDRAAEVTASIPPANCRTSMPASQSQEIEGHYLEREHLKVSETLRDCATVILVPDLVPHLVLVPLVPQILQRYHR